VDMNSFDFSGLIIWVNQQPWLRIVIALLLTFIILYMIFLMGIPTRRKGENNISYATRIYNSLSPDDQQKMDIFLDNLIKKDKDRKHK